METTKTPPISTTSSNSNPELKIVEVNFDLPLAAYQIPKFRGAMIETLGRDLDQFHNHKGEKFYYYRYPVVQYRQNNRKASMVLLILDESGTVLTNILKAAGQTIRIGKEEHVLKLIDMNLKTYTPRITETYQHYRLYHWIGLNTENFKKWQATRGLIQKAEMIQELIPNHIVQFAKRVDWYPQAQIKVEVTALEQFKYVDLHRTKHLAMDLSFRANVALPYQIGLGKGVSYGFGILKKSRRSVE